MVSIDFFLDFTKSSGIEPKREFQTYETESEIGHSRSGYYFMRPDNQVKLRCLTA